MMSTCVMVVITVETTADEERNCDDHGKCCLIRYESGLGFSIDRL